jgi:hypothetical protein
VVVSVIVSSFHLDRTATPPEMHHPDRMNHTVRMMLAVRVLDESVSDRE